MNAWIARKVPSNYYTMTACLRGPDRDAVEQKIRTMLTTARFPLG